MSDPADLHKFPSPSAATSGANNPVPAGYDLETIAKLYRPKNASSGEVEAATLSRFAHHLVDRHGNVLAAKDEESGSNTIVRPNSLGNPNGRGVLTITGVGVSTVVSKSPDLQDPTWARQSTEDILNYDYTTARWYLNLAEQTLTFISANRNTPPIGANNWVKNWDAEAESDEGTVELTITPSGENLIGTKGQLLVFENSNLLFAWVSNYWQQVSLENSINRFFQAEYHYGEEHHIGQAFHSNTEDHSGPEYHSGTEYHNGTVTHNGDEYHNGSEYHNGNEDHYGSEYHNGNESHTGDESHSGNEDHSGPEYHSGSEVHTGNESHTGTESHTGDESHSGVYRELSSSRTGAGVVPLIRPVCKLTSTGAAQAITLDNGLDGQLLTIIHTVDGGSMVLTATTKTGWTTSITFTNAGDLVRLQFFTTLGWVILSSQGVTIV